MIMPVQSYLPGCDTPKPLMVSSIQLLSEMLRAATQLAIFASVFNLKAVQGSVPDMFDKPMLV